MSSVYSVKFTKEEARQFENLKKITGCNSNQLIKNLIKGVYLEPITTT